MLTFTQLDRAQDNEGERKRRLEEQGDAMKELTEVAERLVGLIA